MNSTFSCRNVGATIFLLLGLLVGTLTHGQIIATFAGNGTGAYAGDGGAATAAQINGPRGVAVDATGNVYISDRINNRIRLVNTAGTISTICGTGTAGFSGDGGSAISAQISAPGGIALDGGGTIYFADVANKRIRMINATGVISPIAGTGTVGFSGDGGAATAAMLSNATGVAVDGSSNVYIADAGNNRIRMINASGVISTLAGNGTGTFSGDGGAATAASLYFPFGVAIDGGGNLYIADGSNNCVRKVNTSGIISTIAGIGGSAGFSGDGGAATAANLSSPNAVAVDGSGNIYIADASNNRIRIVIASGTISTMVGTGAASFGGDCGAANAALINSPMAIAYSNSNYLYIADEANNRIRMVYTSLSVAAITGSSTVCAGAAITLADATGGGVWSSANPAIATVDASGNVTGVAGGSTTIIYTITNACGSANATAGITVNTSPVLPAITGPTSVCVGATISLADATAGGSWSSSATAIATIDASGNVRGVAGGSATITYTLTTACGSAARLYSITVTTIPSAGTIAGATGVCPGATITLTNGVSGGTWSSSAASMATISSTGVVLGIAAGSTVISYAVTGVCGTGYSTHALTINSLPVVGPVTGAAILCEGATTTLSDTTAGGVWSSSASGVATVSTGGVVTGMTGAAVNIIYAVTNVCGTASAAHAMTINPLPTTGVILGASAICTGSNTTLTGSVAGGIWSMSNAHATITATAIVHGVSAGYDTVYHSFTNGCGTTAASFIISIDGHLTASGITGPTTLCETDSAQLTVTVPGGSWTSSNGHATVSPTGFVRPVSPGMDTIYYSDSNACGTAVASLAINILAAANCNTGVVAPVDQISDIVVYPNPSNGIFTVVIPATANSSTITIMDVLGKVVATKVVPDNSEPTTIFNLTSVAAGSYLVRITSGTEIYRKTIVID